MKKKLMAWILLFCMITAVLPAAVSPPVDAQAAGNTIHLEGIGDVQVIQSRPDGYSICLDSDRNLIVTGRYYTRSKATLSYHTSVLYFTKEKTNKNPGAMELYYPVDVFTHQSIPEASDPNFVRDTYTVSREQLEEMIRYLYGEDGLNESQEVYVSEGFILKYRNTPSEDWKFNEGKTYSSLSAIRSAANWSETTYENFAKYYDTQITLSLTRYTLTVKANDDNGGIAYGSGSYFSGDSAPVRAVPNEGYTFKEWTVQSGSAGGFDKTKEDTVFTMPSSDVTLIAVFEKEKIPEPTKKPVATPKPGDPTPTPMPTPTLAPTPTPPLPEPGEAYGQNIRYYGTDKGYTMKGIYEQDGPLAGISSAENSRIRSDEYTALDAYYSVGQDSSGNTWYFIPDGTDATFVHPAVYQGKDASSPQVKDIRELVFPETIIYSGKTYTVTSIGGGTDRYHSSKEQHNSSGITSTGYTLGKTSGSCYYNQSVSSTSGTRETYQNINTHTGYCYGVAGNGEITSSGSVHFDFFQDGDYSYTYCDYESSYYVYNTTLEFVTIPDTVTEICDYAFYQCQGLRKITGAEGVKEIGKYAFAGASVLTTTPSVEVSGNYRRYHYNESYSTGIPTDTMRSWQSAVALREYMEPAGFPVLDTIGTYAFAYRKNLFDVKLPDCVAVIKDDAFKACDLNSITIPGKNTAMEGNSGKMAGRDTLGTKGNPDTMIITVPESKAMYYGLTYEDYYTLRCGHPVTYDRNALPAEEYTTAAMLEVLKREIKETFSGKITAESSSGSVSTSAAYEVVLDTEGTLWLKKGGALFPSEVLPGVKFKDICGVTLSEKSFWSGSKTYSYCFAFAENGTVWVYDPGKYGAASWKDTGIPEGSTGHQWCGYPFNDLRYESGSSGYSSENSSSVKRYYLYYADENGRLFRKEMYETASDSFYSSNSGSSSSTSHSLRTGSAAEVLSEPEEGTVFRAFYVMDSVPGRVFLSDSWGDGYSGTTAEYSLYQPVVFAKDTEGNYWKGTGEKTNQRQYSVTDTGGTRTEKTDGFSQTEADAKTLAASGYIWEKIDKIRQIWDGGRKGKGASLNVLDADGNLLFFSDAEKRPASGSNLLHCGEVRTVLSGKNFVAADVVTTDYSLLTDADGGVWAYFYQNEWLPCHVPGKLFDDAQVTAQWETERTYYREEYGKSVSYEEYSLFLLDSRNRIWVTTNTCKTQYHYGSDGSSYTSWAAFGPECLLSGVEKVYLYRAGTAYQEVFVLDGNGSVWTYADNTVSELTEPEPFKDALLKMRKSAYSVGYEFVETLYANMFARPGYRFLSWNTETDGSGTSHRPGERLLLTAPVTLYAQWERAKNIIRYAPNGGSGIMEDDTYEPEVAEVVLKGNTYTKSGYEFTGWNTKADGSGTPYADRASITILPGTTVLYAQWKPFSYVVKVAEDEVRVTPVTVTDTIELEYDEEMTIPAARPDRFYTLAYRLNRKSTMSTVPYWKTADPDADRYTKAALSFRGWQLYEETEAGYYYLGFYKPGETVKNLARQKGCTLYLFPYWGGEASYVDLPTAGCDGYDFIGWSADNNESDVTKVIRAAEGSMMRYRPKGNETLYAYYEPKKYEVALIAEAPDAEPGEITKEQEFVTVTFDQMVPDAGIPLSARYVFLGYYDRLDADGKPAEGAVRYYDENGNGLQVWRVHDGSVTALYAYLISEKEVTLDGRGATKQEQTSVTMTYDKAGPDVIPPEKTGYTFEGYFTGIRGSGKKYFDENGRGIKVWLEKDVDILYACWKQNPVELPEKEDTEVPEVLPETDLVIEAVQESMCVQIYADDNNPDTGAEDDLPPYQISDVYSGTKLLSEGAIPSTECVAIRAQMGSYLFSGILSRKSGITQVRTYTVIRYRTVYEDTETEELIISEPRTATVEVMVPKAWSYWELKEGGLYYPSCAEVKNAALKEKSVRVPVEWEGHENKKPSYTYASYEKHVVWSGYDTDGLPVSTLTAPQEYLIVSDIPGEEPDITEYVTVVAENFARADGSEFKVRNDFLQIGDVTVLSDREQERNSAPPADNIAELLREKIPLTAYEQTYISGVPLFKESKNQTYESSAVCVYEADSCVAGEKKVQRKNAKVNDISIHTPVLCNAVLTASHEDKYQCEEIPEGSTVLVLSEEGVHSDFTVQVLNTGYHSDRKGYGERSYEQYLAEKEGKVQNEIRFPFEVWIDIGNDKDSKNDVLLKEGIWYTIGTERQRFYVPLWTREGEYRLEMRSVAVNGEGSEEKTETVRNIQKENYAAVAEKRVYITGRLYDFTVYDVCGTAAWEEVRGEELSYPVSALPLRAGVHPYYRNVGGLPAGGSFSFRIKSIGSFYGKDTLLTLVPEFVLVTEEGRKAVDVYYEKETAQGVFLKQWGGEEIIVEQYGEKEENPLQYWYGRFLLPDALYAAESRTDVSGYQKQNGLNFSEDFWIKEGELLLQFAIRVENGNGEVLYYGKLPVNLKNDIWRQESGKRICTDTRGNEYLLEGGDTAIIYFGESAAGDYTIHGIH